MVSNIFGKDNYIAPGSTPILIGKMKRNVFSKSEVY